MSILPQAKPTIRGDRNADGSRMPVGWLGITDLRDYEVV